MATTAVEEATDDSRGSVGSYKQQQGQRRKLWTVAVAEASDNDSGSYGRRRRGRSNASLRRATWSTHEALGPRLPSSEHLGAYLNHYLVSWESQCFERIVACRNIGIQKMRIRRNLILHIEN
ncbi:hypothetical protein BHE74_00018913 [Ensete ventricosum]|nr:hypothetical protein BHE74_00018913 [Ensete ventricosum]